MEKSKVYYIKNITKENVVKAFTMLEKELPGKVAVKVHSGEKGNQNFLRPEFFKDIITYVNGTIVECNTAYAGDRNETQKHEYLMEEHGWKKYFDVDIMDALDDMVLDIPNGKVIKKNYVGANIKKYDSMLVLSHFKGHPMGGYGGALKQLSIGCASSSGKAYIHSAGRTTDQYDLWGDLPTQEKFLESMADASKSIVDYFKGNMAFINVMANMSVDCDCCSVAEDPCMQDIGILSSLDPVALDKACVDLIYSSNDKGASKLIERIESRKGIHTIDVSYELGVGNIEYDLIIVE